MRDVVGDVAGESHAEIDDLTTSTFDETTGGSGAPVDGVSADLSTSRRRRRGLWRALINKPTDATEADDQLERKGLWQGARSAHISCIPCGGGHISATGGAEDHDGDQNGDRSTSWSKFPKSISGSSGSRSGRRRDGDDGKDIEAAIRVRTADFDTKSENHYVVVIHGTFDAPPPDGAPTWYQPPAPGEQNFCRKLSRLLALGPIGEDAIWRDLPCSALPGIPYPFHWDGTNTHAGRVTAAMKVRGGNEKEGERRRGEKGEYMAKLGRRSKNEWHPAVARQFWAAHRRSYELIKKWRRIDMRGSRWRFFPLLIVFRGFNGQRASGVKESYPWAYQQWLDSLLRLPAVRQRRFLAFRHATSPITNALGALVFLGTPFYIKKWQSNGFIWLSVSTVLNVVLLYVFILVYTSIWQIIVLLIAGRPEDFYGQSAPPFVIATGIMLLINIKQVMDVLRTTVFYSGNLYHKPSFDWSPAMSALVIHAGKLDEASLALSMEPITRAYVFPHLTKLLKQTPWAPFPKPPTRYARQVDWWAFFFHCAIIFVWDTLFFLPAAIMSVCSHIIAPIVTGSLQKMIVTISFGLSSGDLNYAYIYVDEHLDLDLATQQVDHWNVQKLLAEAKTKSLKGELMPGYEDDTVEQPEWMEPVLQSPRPPSHLHSPHSATPTGAAAASAGSPGDPSTSPLGTQQIQGAFGRPRSRKGVRGGRLTTLAAVAEAAVEANERGVSFGSLEREPQAEASVGVHEREGVGAAAGGYQREQGGETAAGVFEKTQAGVGAGRGGERREAEGRVVMGGVAERVVQKGGSGGEEEWFDAPEGEWEGRGGKSPQKQQMQQKPQKQQKLVRNVSLDRPEEEQQSLERAAEFLAGLNSPPVPSPSPLPRPLPHAPPAFSPHAAGLPTLSVPGVPGGSSTTRAGDPAHSTADEASGKVHDDASASAAAAAAVSVPAVSVPAMSVPEAPAESGKEKLVYEFLWDDQELAVMAEQSQTFQRLKSQMNKIGRNPRLSEREFERQLQQLCVMIEERMGELTGRFDLNHGAYFRDPRILRVIAHFIEKRELPEWSIGIDGDIWRWNENLAKIQSKQLQQMAMGGGGGAGAGGPGNSGGSGGLGGSGGKVGESSSREKEGSGGSSGAAKLRSLIKSMRGGSGREGGFKRSSPSFENIDFNAVDGSGSLGSEGGSEGGSVRGMSSYSGLDSVKGKAVSFGVSGAPRPKLDLPNLKPAAIAAPLRKIRSTVVGVASTVSSTVNVSRHQGDSVPTALNPHHQ
ncbi:unnamed protein product [Closterium sp. NIES-65]|nr:unnamed protein product [Closterium sp. NIES-65]